MPVTVTTVPEHTPHQERNSVKRQLYVTTVFAHTAPSGAHLNPEKPGSFTVVVAQVMVSEVVVEPQYKPYSCPPQRIAEQATMPTKATIRTLCIFMSCFILFVFCLFLQVISYKISIFLTARSFLPLLSAPEKKHWQG